MKATLFAVLGALAWAGCGSAPSAPSTPSPLVAPGSSGSIVSGTVYEADAAGRRPLAGATVEIAESAAWGDYGRPTTDAQEGEFSPAQFSIPRLLSVTAKFRF